MQDRFSLTLNQGSWDASISTGGKLYVGASCLNALYQGWRAICQLFGAARSAAASIEWSEIFRGARELPGELKTGLGQVARAGAVPVTS